MNMELTPVVLVDHSGNFASGEIGTVPAKNLFR
jgi:hypothetical protein